MLSPAASRISLVVFLCVLVSSLLFVAYMVWPYLLAILMGAVLALLTAPLHRKLTSKRISHKLSAALSTFAVMLLVVVPIFVFAIHAVKEGVEFGQHWAVEENLSVKSLEFQLVRRVSRKLGIDFDTVRKQVRAASENAVRWLTASVLGLAKAIPNLILQLILSAITCFFLLLDGRSFMVWLADKIPLDEDVRSELKQSFKNTAISVIWANVAAAATQAAVLMLGFLLLGVPGSFLAGGATFILAWIPMAGTVPVWLAGAVYLYSNGDVVRTVLMVSVGLVAGIADNFVRPLILKGRSDMHPLVSLVAIFGGINLFGIAGAFVGPILAALLISLLEIWPVVGRRFGLLKSSDHPAVPL